MVLPSFAYIINENERMKYGKKHTAIATSIIIIVVIIVINFFNWHNPSNRTMALGSTQPLTEMSIGNNPGG
jgi:uncharacterized membrane protein YvbJ